MGRQHLLHWPPPSIPADSWMPTQEDYLGVHLEKKLLAFTQCLAVHRAVHMSLPETLCHRAATLRAAGTSVATGERDQSWDMLQMQTSATRVWDTRELAPSPARYLGTRGVWKGRLSLREQLCTGFQKKTVGKSCDSLLILIALRYTYVLHKHQLDLLGKIPKSGNWSLKNQPGHWNVAFLPQMK